MVKKGDLKKIRSGGMWTAFGAVAGVFSQLAIMLSLAAFLKPADVGLFSVFLFVVGLGLTIFPFGNDFAFVQASRLAFSDLGRTALAGLFLALSSSILVLISVQYLNIGSTNLMSSIQFGIAVGFTEACFLLCSSVLQRDLEYKSIERANILRQILTLILSLSLLAATHRLEGAFVGRLVSNLVAVGMILLPIARSVETGTPRQRFMSNISRDMLLKNALGHLSLNAEVVAASPQLGVSGLGIYDFGRRIIAQPRDFIGAILFKFTYPLFSNISKIENANVKQRFMRRVYRSVVIGAASVGFPVFASAIILSDPMITMLFGQEWSSSIPIVQIFALTAFVQVLGNNIITSALTATGGSGFVLQAEYLFILPRLLGIYVASLFGPIAVACSMSFFIVTKLCWMQYKLNKRSDLTFRFVALSIRPIVLAMTTGIGAAAPIKFLFLGVYGSISSCLVFLCCYVITLLLLPDNTVPMLKLFRKKLRRKVRNE